MRPFSRRIYLTYRLFRERTDIGDDVSLLGAPPLLVQVLDKSWSDRCDRCDDLAKLPEKLIGIISSQGALILLTCRSSFSAPKLLHLLRCSPSVSHPMLRVRADVQRIPNSGLTDLQWHQAVRQSHNHRLFVWGFFPFLSRVPSPSFLPFVPFPPLP